MEEADTFSYTFNCLPLGLIVWLAHNELTAVDIIEFRPFPRGTSQLKVSLGAQKDHASLCSSSWLGVKYMHGDFNVFSSVLFPVY